MTRAIGTGRFSGTRILRNLGRAFAPDMAAPEASLESRLTNFFESLFDTKFVDSIRDVQTGAAMEPIRVVVHGSGGGSGGSGGSAAQTITVDTLFPFMTCMDLKLELFRRFKFADRAIPEAQFLSRRTDDGYVPIDFAWSLGLVAEAQRVALQDPLARAVDASVDARFVEPSGERRIVGQTLKDRMTLEELGLVGAELHLFLFEDVLGRVAGPRPISERDWNGRIVPYFPGLSSSAQESIAPFREKARTFARGYLRRQELFQKLQEILDAGVNLLPLELTGVKLLRVSFPSPARWNGIESLFYDVPVTARRPYMRLMPAEGSPITKLHLTDDKNPDIQDPRLLIHWTQERSPTPDRDFVLAKLLMRSGSSTQTPLYMAARLFDDGSSDITIEPPRGVRRLDVATDLDELGRITAAGLQGLPLAAGAAAPRITNAMLIFSMSLKGSAATALSVKVLREKLKLLSPVFQEVQPLPGDKPLLMLRYKLISNFYTEDRIQAFITLMLGRLGLAGDSPRDGLVQLVADQFQIDTATAERKVAEVYQLSGEIVLANPETKDFAPNANPGIDIAIYAQHPFYTFHIMRLDSHMSLQRILTFLSVLMSVSPELMTVSPDVLRELDAASNLGALQFQAAREEGTAAEETDADADAADADAFANVEDEFANVDAEPVVAAAPQEAEDAGGAEEFADFDDALWEDKGEDLTLAEADAAADAAAAEAVEGPVEPRAAAPPPKDPRAAGIGAAEALRREFQQDAAAVREDATAARAPAVPATNNDEEPGRAGPTKRGGLETFFSDKLMEADRRLFDYHKSHPSVKKYVSQCGANLMRQPAVLSQAQYERMLDEYKDVLDNGTMTFFVFPLAKDKKQEPYDPSPSKEYYTLMRYGSSEKNIHYYLCCKYFCTRDEILVREVELRGTRLRRPVRQADGSMRTTKAPMTCPFCEGKVISNRQFPKPDEVILERISKPGSVDKRHLYIRFLKKVYHPDGLHLPCCFLDDQPVRIGSPGFPEASAAVYEARRPLTEPTEAAADEFAEAEEGPAPAALDATAPAAPEAEGEDISPTEEDLVSYDETLLKAKFSYIVGSEKLPLEGAVKKVQKVRTGDEELKGTPRIAPPQIGLLPPALNAFFGQDNTELVGRLTNPQKLRAGAQGFLRVGVENRTRFAADAFLAAVAPFFHFNSARKFKEHLLDVIQPRLFVSLNFGNLLLEFYDPTRPKLNRPALFQWARTHFQITKLRRSAEPLFQRVFQSYTAFQEWLTSTDSRKEYRHFAQLLSIPGLLQTRTRKVGLSDTPVPGPVRPGVVFIVLEQQRDGQLIVRCPPYPLSRFVLKSCEFAFLFHHYSGIWEPLFHVDNRAPEERSLEPYTLSFSQSGFQAIRWPAAAKQQIEEFLSTCVKDRRGLGIFTSQSELAASRLIGAHELELQLSAAVGISLYGLIRDSYNHVGALVYRVDAELPDCGSTVGSLVAIPVVEDGYPTLIDMRTNIIMDWDDYERPAAAVVQCFYKRFVEGPFGARGYVPEGLIRSRGTGEFEAVELKNGLFVPATAGAAAAAALPLREVDEMEWQINRRIVMDLSTERQPDLLGEESRLRVKEFNEVYEHLRLTFSKWLASLPGGGTLRRDLEETMFSRQLPLIEKRKRLQILLQKEVVSWLEESEEDAPRQSGLLRVDCRLREESECDGMCTWKADAGKCLLHVPSPSPLKDVPGPGGSSRMILLYRLIDELLRYGGKRTQIFQQRVSRLVSVDRAIVMGDQYILPEKSATWAEILRLDWSKDKQEQPKFLEEMRRPAGEAPGAAEPPPVTELTAVPAPVLELLGAADPKTARLRLYPSPTGALDPLLVVVNLDAERVGLPVDAAEFTEAARTQFVKLTKVPLVVFDASDPGAAVKTHLNRPFPLKDTINEFVVLVRDERRVSLVVVQPDDPDVLTRADLPEKLRAFIFEKKSMKDSAVAAAPA